MHYENKINKLKEGLNDEYNWEILQGTVLMYQKKQKNRKKDKKK